ncbi:hypothetical protein AB6869_22055 [Rahnella rivi]|uniref:hypothetical protein n=1 Tax=Rahnella rivi TaxID=2816249 RepID=UPI0039BE95E6
MDIGEVGKSPHPVKKPATPAHKIAEEKPAQYGGHTKGDHRHGRLITAGGVWGIGLHEVFPDTEAMASAVAE